MDTLNINFINQTRLFNELINNIGEILVFDFRSKEDYTIHFNKYSINIPANKIGYDFCLKYDQQGWISGFSDSENRIAMSKVKRLYCLVVANNVTDKQSLVSIYQQLGKDGSIREEDDATVKGLLFYTMLFNSKIRELGFFVGSYKKFLEDYSYLTYSFSYKSEKLGCMDFYPSTILDYRVFVGDQTHSSNLDLLRIFKITHILNVTDHFDNRFERQGIKYLKICIDDTDKESMSKHFSAIYNFIDQALFGENIFPNYVVKSSDTKLLRRKSSVSGKDNVTFYTDPFEMENSDYKDFLLKQLKLIQEKMQLNDSVCLKNDLLQTLFKIFVLDAANLNGFLTGNRLLVHCSLGVSRSSASLLCYLMKKFEKSFEFCNEVLKFQRNKACPIQKFVNELEEFEKNDFCFC